MNIIGKAQLDSVPRVLLFLHVEKAFDCIEWPNLHTISEKFGIGHFLQPWLRMIYIDHIAIISMDGMNSETVWLERGVRQGCPLFPFLFALALESVAIAIRKDEDIKGLQIREGSC